MRKKVFIIGNGFDLNLGWKTSYKDFISSEYWPLRDKEPYCLMAEYLKIFEMKMLTGEDVIR